MKGMLNTETSEQKDHAEYSASGSSRWMNCAASLAASRDVPPLPESKYAAEGTRAHSCLELIMQNRRNMVAAIQLALKTYPKDMVGHAVEAVKYVMMRAEEFPGSEILCEQKVNSSSFLGVPGQFGTLDISIVQPFGRLIIADYKYGAGIAVDPREEDGEFNSQLVYYALALSEAYDHNFSEVELVVIQPRAFHVEGTVRSAVGTMDELFSWREKFAAGVKRTQDPNAPRNAGKWCKFCPVSLNCPELKDNALRQARIDFSDSKGVVALPEVRTIPNLGTILDACDKLEEWIGKVRSHAMDVLERGGTVEGYKLVEKKGIRGWRGDVAKVAEEAQLLWGDEVMTAPTLKSPAQLEKTFGKDIKPWVASMVHAPSSGTTMVKATDKRPPINRITEDFEVIQSDN